MGVSLGSESGAERLCGEEPFEVGGQTHLHALDADRAQRLEMLPEVTLDGEDPDPHVLLPVNGDGRGGPDPHQPRTARRSLSGSVPSSRPRIGASIPFETSRMILGSS